MTLLEGVFAPPPPPAAEGATAERSFTGRCDTINLQSNWHNQRLHKSYQHSQAPGACWGDTSMALLQNATCQSALSDSCHEVDPAHCHSDGSGSGAIFFFFQNGNIYILSAAKCNQSESLNTNSTCGVEFFSCIYCIGVDVSSVFSFYTFLRLF